MNVIIKELSCGVCLVALPLLFFVGCICSNPRPVSKGVDDSECVRVRMASLLSAMPPKYEADVQDEQERRLCEIAHEFRNGSSAKERVISLEKLDACLGSIRKSGKSVSIDYLMEHLGCVVDSEGEGSCGFRIRVEKMTPCSLIVQWDSNRVIVYSTFVRGYFI